MGGAFCCTRPPAPAPLGLPLLRSGCLCSAQAAPAPLRLLLLREAACASMGGTGLGRAFENQSGLQVGWPLQNVERPEQDRVGCLAAPVQGFCRQRIALPAPCWA